MNNSKIAVHDKGLISCDFNGNYHESWSSVRDKAIKFFNTTQKQVTFRIENDL